ncbi:hypothetical protein [Caballeronia sp. KNU42]
MASAEELQVALANALAGRGAANINFPVLPPQPLSLPVEMKIDLLKERVKAARVKHQFEPGQIVKWKDGLQSRTLPAIGEPAIVIEVLENPVFDSTSDAGNPAFREALDIRVGCLGTQGQILIFHFSSFRFEPFSA